MRHGHGHHTHRHTGQQESTGVECAILAIYNCTLADRCEVKCALCAVCNGIYYLFKQNRKAPHLAMHPAGPRCVGAPELT
jgi:hypothetical protein